MTTYRKYRNWLFAPLMSGLAVWAASGAFSWGLAAAIIVACILEGLLQATNLLLDEMRTAGILPQKTEESAADAAGDRRG